MFITYPISHHNHFQPSWLKTSAHLKKSSQNARDSVKVVCHALRIAKITLYILVIVSSIIAMLFKAVMLLMAVWVKKDKLHILIGGICVLPF